MKNPSIKNDYQMNQEIANKIIEIIENGDVQMWRKTWTTSAGKTREQIYNLVIEGQIAVNVFTKLQYEGLMIPSGFYLTFKQIKDKKLHLQKGSKGIANYKAAKFNKYLTQNEQKALELELENKEELKEEIKELKEGKRPFGVRVQFEYVDTKNNQKKFDEVLFWELRKQAFYYKKFQYVLEYLFKAEDCGITNEDITSLHVTIGLDSISSFKLVSMNYFSFL